MLAALLVIVPCAAAVIFLGGFAWRVWQWASTPVPFPIPTTAGQQKGLRFLKPGRLESPSSAVAVAGRVALEVLLFRSLFRQTGHRRTAGGRLLFPEQKALWAASLVFHASLLVILIRHLRFFIEPVPAFVAALSALDAFFRVGTPAWYASDVLVVIALTWLLLRRVRDPLLRYLSLPADYCAIGLLLAVAGSGLVLRYLARPDVVAAKALALGLVSFQPRAALGDPAAGALIAPSAGGLWFWGHLVLASALVAVFPFTKLMHGPAAFLVPTRAMSTDTRRRRHVNPWNAPVQVHTYGQWEEEFRDKIRAAGLDDAVAGLANGQESTVNGPQ